MNIVQVNDKVIVNGIELSPCPSKSNHINSTIVNEKIYLNGYEYKNGEWKRTLAALWYWLF